MQEKSLEKKPFPKSVFVSFIILLAIFVGIIGGMYYKKIQGTISTQDAFITGFRVDVSPDILGRVVTLKVDEGDEVQKGDLLAILEQDILLSQKGQAQAQIESVSQEVKLKKAHFEKVDNDYQRALSGIQDQIISSQSYDHAQKDLEIAEAGYQKSLADLALSQAHLDVIDTHLHHTYIYSPCHGTISKRWIYIGDVLSPGQNIFTLYHLENIWVQANLSEKKIRKVRLGDPVEIYVDAYPGHVFHGKIFTIKAAAASQFSVIPPNNATGNYTKVAQRIPIKISIDPSSFPKQSKELYLFPGMNVEVKIKVQP